MSEYKDTGNGQDNNNKEVRESNNNIDSSTNQGKNKIESQAPNKKHFNVLNEDGSLADLPDQDAEGLGTGDGTIGKS